MEIMVNNYDVLRESYAPLLAKLESYPLEDKTVKTQKAENGETILIKEKNERIWILNSGINPTEAAACYAERYEIRKYTTYYVFGLSDGRCIRSLLQKCDDTNKLIVCEPDAENFYMCLVNCDISDLLKDRRIHLYVPGMTMEIEEILNDTMDYADIKRTEFCILPAYDVLYRDKCEQFMDKIMDKCTDEVLKMGTSLKSGRTIVQNTLGNMKRMIREKNIEQLRQKLEGKIPDGMPAIIVSAGPSLDKNVGELKKAKGKALIIVVDAALRTVIRAGIKPDIVCTVDPNVPERFFDKMDLSQITWCCDRLTRNTIAEQLCNNIYYYGVFSYDWNQILNQTLGYPFPNMTIGGNITSVAYALACYLGFRTIVLIGQDMAFTNGVSHTAGIEDALGDGKKYIESRVLVQVEGIDGKMLDTDVQMWYYKRWFEKSIDANKDTLEVINATEGGAKIEGAQNRRLRDVIQERCLETFDFESLEKEIPPAFSAEQQKKLNARYQEIAEDLLSLKTHIQETLVMQRRLLKEQKQMTAGQFREGLAQMMKKNEEIEELPWFDLMIFYAQKEEYEMSDRLCVKEEPSIEELIENNISLYEAYENGTDQFLEDIKSFLD